MLATRFDDLFSIPVRAQKARIISAAPILPSRRTAEELEFSEFARSPRQGIGWVLFALLGFWAAVAALVAIAIQLA